MNVAAVIAEYNPFHFGHQFHLQETRKQTHADALVVVMSGFFTQRGQPAILQPWQRAKAAIQHGADLVILLPAISSLQPADGFAAGGVSMASQLPGVQFLSFGAETPCLEDLTTVANALLHDSVQVEFAKEEQKAGGNFGRTQANAMGRHPKLQSLAPILNRPNNILAISYIKAILSQGSSLQPHVVARIGAGYLDEELQPLASASALRKALSEGASLYAHLPAASYAVLEEERAQSRLITSTEQFSAQILTLLQRANLDDIAELPEMVEGLENRFMLFRNAATIQEFIRSVKSKRYPYSKLQRSLFHLLLGIRKSDLPAPQTPMPYALVLAYNATGQKLLSQWRKTSGIPLITRPVRQRAELTDYGKRLLDIDRLASEVWTLALPAPYRQPGLWCKQMPIRISVAMSGETEALPEE